MTRVASPMPSFAIISSNAAGVGRNVGGAFASRIATGDEIDRARHVRLGVAALPHVDDADVRVGRVRGDPVGLDELFGMGVRDGQHKPDAVSMAQSLAQAPRISI